MDMKLGKAGGYDGVCGNAESWRWAGSGLAVTPFQLMLATNHGIKRLN